MKLDLLAKTHLYGSSRCLIDWVFLVILLHDSHICGLHFSPCFGHMCICQHIQSVIP